MDDGVLGEEEGAALVVRFHALQVPDGEHVLVPRVGRAGPGARPARALAIDVGDSEEKQRRASYEPEPTKNEH